MSRNEAMRSDIEEVFSRFKRQEITKAQAVQLLGRLGAGSPLRLRPASGEPPVVVHPADSEPAREEGHWRERIQTAPAETPEKTEALHREHATSQDHPVMTFLEEWERCELSSPSPKSGSVLCFLGDGDEWLESQRQLSAWCPELKIITVLEGSLFQKHSTSEYTVPRADSAGYVRLITEIISDGHRVESALYLWALADGKLRDIQPIIYLVQALAGSTLKAGRLTLAGNFENPLERCYLDAWIAFARSLQHVLLETQTSVVALEGARSPSDCMTILAREVAAHKAENVLHASTGRHVLKNRPCTYSRTVNCLRSGGTYLITGGAGGLGMLVAEHLATRYAANLVLVGRSPLDEGRRSQLAKLEALGGQAIYVQANVCSLLEMERAIVQAKSQFGGLQGVVHAAAVRDDGSSLLKRDLEAFEKVLQPKIEGTLVLEEALRNERLDFVCYFSSSSAILGDFGACAYAMANRFMMAYAQHGPGPIKRVAIGWPLWREGRMSFSQETARDLYLQASGQRLLETGEGLAWFESALEYKGSVLLIAGSPKPVHRFLAIAPEKVADTVKPPHVPSLRTPEMTGWGLDQCLAGSLSKMAAGILGLDRGRLTGLSSFAELGFDSINLAEYARKISWSYGFDVGPSTFFSYPTLHQLCQHLLEQHRAALETCYAEVEAPALVPRKTSNSVGDGHSVQAPQDVPKAPLRAGVSQEDVADEIAIIGMSGRFPGARTVDEMWRTLVEGRDAVSEIPATRFDWRPYYDQRPQQPGKMDGKWMGVLPGVSEFDALFFEISPRDAEQMDPRQRLLLQEAWKALEDAGYGSHLLRSANIGVFVGVEQGHYQTLLGTGAGTITSNHDGILAARLSYFLDLHGPTMAINTACSSGLVAVHQACTSIRLKECNTAVVAAANLLLTPQTFVGMSQAGMLSPDGKCYAFDRRANGIVPGEAAVAVVLKRLSAAEADGDPIYAVIRGSGINCDGKTNGITAPNGGAQSRLLSEIYERANLNPRDIGYVIAHGTGTRLGDPIEIKALDDAFKAYTGDFQFCALTSSKANFGHTFAASGLVSLVALLQSLEHEIIPPGLHCEQDSDYVDWSTSAFYVNRKGVAWQKQDHRKRLGAVSSFGMSGTNAHMVIEGYDRRHSERMPSEHPCYLLPLSAKTQSALIRRVDDLLQYLETSALARPSLWEISYTLLCGRQHLSHRCALLARDREHAIILCRQFLEGASQPNIRRNVVSVGVTPQKLMLEYAEDTLRRLTSIGQTHQPYQDGLAALAELYCQGYAPDWSLMFDGDRPRRVHLPTYSFDREEHWAASDGSNDGRSQDAVAVKLLHPLLHENVSDMGSQRFRSWLSGKEFYLADHVVGGQKVLPGVAYLEMARTAIERSTQPEGDWMELSNVVWQKPLVVADGPVCVEIELFREEQGKIRYEIYSGAREQNDRSVHGQGVAGWVSGGEVPRLNLFALQNLCVGHGVDGEICYEEFARAGLSYGPGHRSVTRLRVGEDEWGNSFVLGELASPAATEKNAGDYILHPGVLDGALQAALELRIGDGRERKRPGLPFAVEKVTIYGKSCARNWVWVRESNRASAQVSRLDIDVSDESGLVWIRLEGLYDRALSAEGKDGAPNLADQGVLLLQPVWKETAFVAEDVERSSTSVMVLLCGMAEVKQHLANRLPAAVSCAVLPGDESERVGQVYAARARQTLLLLQERLRQNADGPFLVQLVSRSEGHDALHAGLWGLLKTAQLENPRLTPQLILVEDSASVEVVAAQLQENQRWGRAGLLCYRAGRRQVAQWEELVEQSKQTEGDARRELFRPGGLYLITGGAGGLGLLLAEEIIRQTDGARIMLTGRSELNGELEEKLTRFRAHGATVEYRQVDVCDPVALEEMLLQLHRQQGAIAGVIHCAGIIQDSFLKTKSTMDLDAVLGPKVAGVVNLDELLQKENLDFFVMFSSVTGSWGNVGQGDYAAANGFMDSYARWRAGKVKAGQRWGTTVSIGWPLWQAGRMKAAAWFVEQMREISGAEPLTTDRGLEAFYRAMFSGQAHVVIVHGDRSHLRETLLNGSPRPQPRSFSQGATMITKTLSPANLVEEAKRYFKQVLASALKLDADRIECDATVDKYGLDSIIAMKIVRDLEKSFGPLSVTLFFEYNTVELLARHFVEHYSAKLGLILEAGPTPKGAAFRKAASATQPVLARSARSPHSPGERAKKLSPAGEDIAIIGMSGRYPQARNPGELWDNLISGRDCVTEIPASRWDHRDYFDPEKGKPGKSYCKWGGFLDGVDEFDPLFFNISPREAEFIDPQERLFLQCAYETLEAAGYTPEVLQPYRARAGVFVGAMYQQYRAPASDAAHSAVTSLASYSSIANRVSHFFDLRGPSVAVDTMCSSAALAIHLACQVLASGECSLALAGGVNLSLTPAKYSGLCHLRMLGSSGSSRSFGRGDGYLPAEAIGAVLLKPLAAAIADNDRILAVVKGTATNHGGHSGGYSVPSLSQQAQLLEDLFCKANIDARSISYLEPSATGSSVSDAIEFRALRKVFPDRQDGQRYCAIGSIKTNIGHAEAASAMTQLGKIVLQLQHQVLAPSIAPENVNAEINFREGPFTLQLSAQDWKPAQLFESGQLVEHPRRALLNAFGAGGSNVSILLEEYRPLFRTAATPREELKPRIFVFSAKSKTALLRRVKQMVEYLDTDSALSLHDFAWTLQLGREAMRYRAAVIATDRAELISKASEILNDQRDLSISSCFTGTTETLPPVLHRLLSGKSGEAMVQALIADQDWAGIAGLWVQGAKIPWMSLYDQPATLLPLPTYPFERERYWFGTDEVSWENPELQAAEINATESASCCTVEDKLKRIISETLMVPLDRIDSRSSFRSYGMDSIGSIRLRERCEGAFGIRISGKDLLAHQTVDLLAPFILSNLRANTDQLEAAETEEPGRSATHKTHSDLQAPSMVAQLARRPLSEGEKGLWLLQRLTPTMSAYNVPICFNVQGTFDVEAFRGACEYALRRHPVLADMIVDERGVPYRAVAQPSARYFQQEDMCREDTASVRERLRERATTPIDLSTGPMMCVTVVNQGKEVSWVLILIHHLSFDAGSILPFLSQLLNDYAKLALGEQVLFVPAKSSYQDFVEWEQNMLAGSEGREHLEYFRRKLLGMPSALELPIDRPYPARSNCAGATRVLNVPQRLAERISWLCMAQEVTLSTVFLGVYQMMLAQVSGSDDIVIGVSTAVRPGSKFEQLVGYFVSMVPVRKVIDRSQSWREYVKELDCDVAEALDHASFAFPTLVRNLKIKRVQRRHPVFQVAYTYQSLVSIDALRALQESRDGLSIHFDSELRQQGEYEIVLEVCEEKSDFLINFKYNMEIFDESTIAHMEKAYLDLLEAIAGDADAAIGSYVQTNAGASNVVHQ